MKTALDTSVILDVLTNDPRWADASERAIRQAAQNGQLIVGECVVAEIAPTLPAGEVQDFLSDWQIEFQPSTLQSALLAGETYKKYLARSGKPKRVLPDFLIAAHAACHAGRLLARDRGYYRDYFQKLTVLSP